MSDDKKPSAPELSSSDEAEKSAKAPVKKSTGKKITIVEHTEDGPTENAPIPDDSVSTPTEAELSEEDTPARKDDSQAAEEPLALDVESETETEPDTEDEPEVEPEHTPDTDSEAENEEVAVEESAVEVEASPPDTTELPEPAASTPEAPSLESPETSQAVDDIVREESDIVLDVEDEAIPIAVPLKRQQTFKQKVGSFFRGWWENRPARYGTLAGLFLLFTALLVIPGTRYGLLNAFGVRVESTMTIVDNQTRLPLSNIPVSLQGKEQRSDEEGKIIFTDMKLGSSQLLIDKKGYEKVDKEVVLGWGSNPLGETGIVATGTQYTFYLKDWLSGQAVLQAEATSGEDTAKSDGEGKIILTVGEDSEEAEVSISADGYRTETFTLASLQDENNITMVPGKKHVFVSNRSGKYDLYKIDVDGKNEEILLASTGKEREIPFVLSHPTEDIAAYISSRDGERNKDGFVLDGLFVINAKTNEVTKVTRSEQLQVLGWIGQKVVYVAVVEGTSAGNGSRSKLFAYDAVTTERTELASSNYFNDAKIVGNTVYYTVSSYAVPQSSAKAFSIDADGKNKKTLVDNQVWSIIRPAYDTLLFNSEDTSWYKQTVGNETVEKLQEVPTNTNGRRYTDSPNKKLSAWVDVRDGKGVLLVYDVDKKEDKQVLVAPGLADPLLWVDNNHLIYRVSTSQETADYIVNLQGGEPKKISDVTGNRSYYFGF